MTLYGCSKVFTIALFLFCVGINDNTYDTAFSYDINQINCKPLWNTIAFNPGKQKLWFFPHQPIEAFDFALRQGTPNKAQLNCQVKSRFRRRLCRSQGAWNTKKPLIQLSLNLKNIRLMVRKSQVQPPAMQQKNPAKTWDIKYCWWKNPANHLIWYPIICRFFFTSTSQVVVWDFWTIKNTHTHKKQRNK